MKILLLNQAFYPDSVSTSQHVTDLALYLCHERHQVSVITGRRNYNHPKTVYPKEEFYQGVKIHRVLNTGYGKRSFFTRLSDAITFQIALVWKLLTVPKPDLVVAFTSPPLIGFVATLFCWLRGVSCVQWLMDINPHTAEAVGYLKRRSLASKFLHQVFEFTMRKSDHVVVLDRWMKARAVEDGASSEKVAIVPPWPVQKNTEKKAEGSEFRRRHKLEHKFVVLYSGNHSIAHPLDTLLSAAKELKEDKDIVFVFVGSGLRVGDVSKAIEEFDLDNVIQLPHQPLARLGETLAAADVHFVVMGENVTGLVHPSKIYGVLATGKPYVFVGPTKSAVVDLLQECPGGYHINHGDVSGLATLLRQLQEKSFEELAAVSSRNSEFVKEHFSAERCMSLFKASVLEPAERKIQAHTKAPSLKPTSQES